MLSSIDRVKDSLRTKLEEVLGVSLHKNELHEKPVSGDDR